MRRLTTLCAIGLAVLASGCATTHLPSMAEMLRDATDQNGRACVRKPDIDGYGVLENDVVSIDGGQDYYLATLLPGCTNISTSIGVILDGDFGEICGRSADEVLTDEDSCYIDQMFEFDDREEAFATFNEVMETRESLGEE